jgi:hypothetical protein
VLGALVGDLARAHVVEVALVGGRIFLVIGEGCARIALFLRQLIQQPIRAHYRFDVLALVALVAGCAQRKLLRGMPIAGVAVSRREQRFVLADQAPIAQGARFLVVIAQELDGIAIAPLIDIRARDVSADRVGAQRLTDVNAGVDGVEELSQVAAQPAAAIQRFQAHVRAATGAGTRRVLAHDPVCVAEPEIVLAHLVVDVSHDQQTLLAGVLVFDLRQQLEKRTEMRKRLVVLRCYRLNVRDGRRRAEAQRGVLGPFDDRLQERHRPRVVAGIGELPAPEIRQVLLLGFR